MWKIINKYSKLSNILDSFLSPFINISRKLQNNINPIFSKFPQLDNKLKNWLAWWLWMYALISWIYSAIKIFWIFGLLVQWFPILKVLGFVLTFFLTYPYFSSIDWLRHSKRSWYDLLYLAMLWELVVFILFALAWSINILHILTIGIILYILSQTKNNFR